MVAREPPDVTFARYRVMKFLCPCVQKAYCFRNTNWTNLVQVKGDGELLWNCDETGICTAVASRKLLARRRQKNVHETTGGSGRDYITLLSCGSAIGERLPPYIIYKGKQLMLRNTQGGPPGTCYSMSESGWMESANFLNWFDKLFLPAVTEILQTGPVILFLDGHHSHASLALVERARQMGVILYVFPPHTTHLLQPLDVGVFGPLKHVWSQVLKEFTIGTRAVKVDKLIFPSLVSKMWHQVVLPEHLIGGFRASGLHPLCRDAIDGEKLKTSLPFQASSVQDSEAHTGTPVRISSHIAVDSSATPVSISIAQYFGKLFINDNSLAAPPKTSKRLCLKHYGEALTEDEIFERIREAEERKKERVSQKKKKSTAKRREEGQDENVCQGCNAFYDDDDEETQKGWIGCDERGCWRWYHYWCAGELDIPDPKLKWVCPACKEST